MCFVEVGRVILSPRQPVVSLPFTAAYNVHPDTKKDQQMESRHHMNRGLRHLPPPLDPELAQRCPILWMAPLSPSFLPAEALQVALAEQRRLSCSQVSQPAIGTCIFSECCRYGISKTASRHPCQLLFAELEGH